jgi:hypothetical protein
MDRHQVTCLVVTDEDGKFLGLAGSQDLPRP